MQKTILITGSTDGIGLETAKMLALKGHVIILHGRNPVKLADAEKTLAQVPGAGPVEGYTADLSRLTEVEALAKTIAEKHDRLDVLLNNAGILRTADTVTEDGLDIRFAVNTIAPYLLTKRLLPQLGKTGRIVNVSSAAQSPIDHRALAGDKKLSEMEAYAQSKLAITMWSRHLSEKLGKDGPAIVAVNPGSLLGSKMVKQGFGIDGKDIGIGAEILARAAISDDFAGATGQYFDNDSGRFAPPHRDALDAGKCGQVVQGIEAILAEWGKQAWFTPD